MLRDVCRTVEHVDTDASGVLHFTRYASLLESAVLENLESLGVGVTRLAEQGMDLAVAELRMKYVAPARFADQVRVTTRVERVGGASCQITGDLHRVAPETLLASGTLVLCVVDTAAGTASPLPAELRRALRERSASDD
ncbi:MAG TPA: thioesterase family protein [Pseudonocardiaceae bacterium]|nr:thioesterase family protein [Pseudonocardiaceae bacterium]